MRLFLILALAAISVCESRTEVVPSGPSEVERSVWMPYSYRAVLDENGIQAGWALAAFRLEGMGVGSPGKLLLHSSTLRRPTWMR